MSSLSQKARSAVIWNAGFNLFRDLLQFGTMLVLVRLLTPEAYGQFGLVTSIIGFLAIFSFNSFIAHSLQVPDDAGAQWQNHFTAGLVLQVGMFVLANVVALVLRAFPDYAPVAPLVHLMSLTFLLEWPSSLRVKMLERSFDFRRLRLLHAGGLLFSSAASVCLAAYGAGTFALLGPGLLVTLPFIYDLFIWFKWRPAWSWSWSDFRPAWRFGLMRLGSGLAGSGRQLAESGVLTAVVGFATLGVFTRSIGLATLFCQKIASQLMYAIYPLLTRVEGHGGNPARIGGLVLRLVAWIVVPVAIVFSVLAAPVVQVVYGAQWTAVTPLLPWAMGWGALAAVVHAAYMLLLARQQARLCFWADLAVLAGTGLALWLVLPVGTEAYLISLVAVQAVVVSALLATLTRFAAVTWRGLFEAFFPPVLAGALAWGALLVVQGGLGWGNPAKFGPALAWGLAFGLLYLLVLRLGFKDQLSELVKYFPARREIAASLRLSIG